MYFVTLFLGPDQVYIKFTCTAKYATYHDTISIWSFRVTRYLVTSYKLTRNHAVSVYIPCTFAVSILTTRARNNIRFNRETRDMRYSCSSWLDIIPNWPSLNFQPDLIGLADGYSMIPYISACRIVLVIRTTAPYVFYLRFSLEYCRIFHSNIIIDRLLSIIIHLVQGRIKGVVWENGSPSVTD